MNTLLIITLAVAVPVYALLWHNQSARNQRENNRKRGCFHSFIQPIMADAARGSGCALGGFKHSNKMANPKDSYLQQDNNLIELYDSRFPNK